MYHSSPFGTLEMPIGSVVLLRRAVFGAVLHPRPLTQGGSTVQSRVAMCDTLAYSLIVASFCRAVPRSAPRCIRIAWVQGQYYFHPDAWDLISGEVGELHIAAAAQMTSSVSAAYMMDVVCM